MRFPLDEVVLLALSNIHKGTKSKKVGDKVKFIKKPAGKILQAFL